MPFTPDDIEPIGYAPGTAAHDYSVSRDGKQLGMVRKIRVDYQVFARADGPAPDGLVVTVNSPDERDPPATERFPIVTETGEVELTTPVDPSHRHDLFASAATPDELASERVRVDLEPHTSEGWNAA